MIRLIDWMAIGLVIYFAYSYSHSNLNSVQDADANADTPADYKPPIAAMIAMVLVLILTIYQVFSLIDFRLALKLTPEDPLPDYVYPLNLAIRLFAWLTTAILVGVLMYGKGDRSGGRDAKTRSIGLAISLVNLVIWAGITFWYFKYIHK